MKVSEVIGGFGAGEKMDELCALYYLFDKCIATYGQTPMDAGGKQISKLGRRSHFKTHRATR